MFTSSRARAAASWARASVWAAAFIALLFTASAHAQELTAEDMTLAGMQLGKSTLQEALSQFGVAPLRHGTVDELCYRSEIPLQATWVLFGSGDEGDYEKLTQFRVLSSPPADITCPPSARITPELPTQSGIRIGMPADELKPRLGPRLRITVDDGRVTSYEVRLTP
jgi:hypothetical protein